MNMRSNNEKLIINGNAFYELDLDCVEKRQKEKEIRQTRQTQPTPAKKRQRN